MIYLFIIFALGNGQQTSYQEAVNLVKNGYLTLSERADIQFVFNGYRWFETTEWQAEPGKNGAVTVIFKGTIDDEKATKDFEEKNQYKWREAMKSMQIASTYDLDKDKDKLQFVIRFSVQNNSFEVEGAQLGIRRTSDQSWRYVTMSERAAAKTLEGIYRNTDPYLVLVNGLPYR